MLVSCADQWSHKKLLQLNGLFLNGKKLRVCAAETQCTVAELCEIVDERVEQMEELKAMAGEVGCEAPVRAVAQESSSSTETRVTVKDAPSKGKGKEAGSGALPCPAGKPASSVQCLACWHFGRHDSHDYKKCDFSRQVHREGKFCSWCARRGYEARHSYAGCTRWKTE